MQLLNIMHDSILVIFGHYLYKQVLIWSDRYRCADQYLPLQAILIKSTGQLLHLVSTEETKIVWIFLIHCFWSRLWLWLWPPFKFHKELLIGSAGDFAKFWGSNYVREKKLLWSNCIVFISMIWIRLPVGLPLLSLFFSHPHTPLEKTQKKSSDLVSAGFP